MDLLDQCSELLIQDCLEHLDDLWKMGSVPGDDDAGERDADDLADCPQCGGECCEVTTTLQAISDDACTGQFDLRCQRCAFTGVLYGFVCEREDHPRAAVSLGPYTLP
jgi:hypothetical protein